MMKTTVARILIDSVVSLTIIQSIMGDAVKETMTIILVALVVSITNVILLPLIKLIIEKIKVHTNDDVDDKLDSLYNVIEDMLNKKKDEIIEDIEDEEDDDKCG